MSIFVVPAAFAGVHVGEFVPPVLASAVYLILFTKRSRMLRRDGRPIPRWRAASFVTGVATMALVQLPPFDTVADQVLAVHMVQHIILGDIASLLIVLGLTGPMIQPLLHARVTRLLRTLAHPIAALSLWTVNLYVWHLPLFYQLAIRHDLVHALEHACFVWFGALLWLGLIGPLPKPSWFRTAGRLAYVACVRLAGSILGMVLIWIQTVVYPVYRTADAARGLSPLSDQNLAGGAMMVEQMILTILLLGWLFYRFVSQEEQRQSLLDLASRRGVELTDERAARAAAAGRAAHLRKRLMQTSSADSGRGHTGGSSQSSGNSIAG